MELTVALSISIISCVLTVCNFAIGRKDKAVKDSKENSQELIKYQLNELKDDVKEILNKLEKYETDAKKMVDEAVELHIKLYHSNVKKEGK